ncbi:MAG TPA: M28 family peptidase [Lentimicrobium sp.]|nr:M28 family peptidase [Lentimicrobium sp.]
MSLNFKTVLLLLVNSLFVAALSGQDLTRARKVMDTLASPSMYGRGYVSNGTGIAADYIAGEMKKSGLKPLTTDYKQNFTTNIKTYPGPVNLSINGKELKAGTDFALITGTPSVKGTFKIQAIDSTWFIKNTRIQKLNKKDLSNTLIMYNPSEMKGKIKRLADSLFRYNYLKCAGFIHIIDKPTISWSVMAPADPFEFPVLTVLKSSLPRNPRKAHVLIELKVIPDYKLTNVIGYLPGTTVTADINGFTSNNAVADSFVVVTAHYDHLGMLGKDAMFPGANDNASGTAMMLDMAEYYSRPENRQPFGMIFIAFAGEELGLKGSNYCAESSPFDLKKVKFLINLDMVGTGSEGITVVNGEQLPAFYERMVKINSENEYVVKVAKRGESCNSDHCPFYKKGVPAIFIYSNGKEHLEYHNIYDQAARVPFTEYEDIFRLIRDFINTL